jgi:aspartyl protease family protein
MRGVVTIIAVFAALVLGLSLMFPEALRGAGENGTLIALIQSLMVAILVGAGLFGQRGQGRIGLMDGLKYGAIWLGIALFLIAAYAQREGFAALWAGIKGEINPAAAQSRGQAVILRKSNDGHFWAQVRINGQSIRMMVDTGASDIALSPEDARRVGLDPQTLTFNIPVSTANGPSTAAGVRLNSVGIETIVRDNVAASVMRAEGGVSLLGMRFLGTLSEVRVEGDQLTLRD